jgi:DNA repair protein RecO (recombination protein O)
VTLQSRALLLRRVNYRDSDLMVTLFTESLGKVSALARGARKSKTRFVGSLEAMHTLRVELREARHGDLLEIKEAVLDKVRLGLTSSLDGLDAAGRLLLWVRTAAPERTPEPTLYKTLNDALDRLDETLRPETVASELATAGLRLLTALGWALDFEHCVACGKPCPDAKPAYLDPARGGLVCASCGRGTVLLSKEQRENFARAAEGGPVAELDPTASRLALRLVEDALAAHAGTR